MREIPVNFNDPDCPVRQVMDILGNKWMIRVLYVLSKGTHRYNELRRSVDGISHKMLTTSLRELEQHGLVLRVVHPVIPPHVDYSLTPLGAGFVRTVWEIAYWAFDHADELSLSKKTVPTIELSQG